MQGQESPANSNSASSTELTVTPRKTVRWPRWIGATLVVILIVLVLHRHRKNSNTRSDAVSTGNTTPHIRIATAQKGDIGSYIDAIGNVTPVSTINLYSQVTGLVESVHYVEGQLVKKGDPLIDIDPRPYQAQLQQAQGTLDRDRASLQQAEMDLARYQQASVNDAVARQTYEDQKMTVAQDQGTVRNDMGQVAYAEVQLGYCHIVSPINGRIGLRLVDPGNTIFSGSSSPIAVITQLQPITVVFNVAEDNLNQLRGEITRRQDMSLDLYDRSDKVKVATGRLLTLDNQVDMSTGTIRFRGQFDNKNLSLFPNQFVNARLLVRTLRDVVLVPTGAVQHNGTQAFVYVISGNVATIHTVTELASDGTHTAVSDVGDGAVVALSGFDKLQDNAKVELQAQSGPGGATRSDATGVRQ